MTDEKSGTDGTGGKAETDETSETYEAGRTEETGGRVQTVRTRKDESEKIRQKVILRVLKEMK